MAGQDYTGALFMAVQVVGRRITCSRPPSSLTRRGPQLSYNDWMESDNDIHFTGNNNFAVLRRACRTTDRA